MCYLFLLYVFVEIISKLQTLHRNVPVTHSVRRLSLVGCVVCLYTLIPPDDSTSELNDVYLITENKMLS